MMSYEFIEYFMPCLPETRVWIVVNNHGIIFWDKKVFGEAEK